MVDLSQCLYVVRDERDRNDTNLAILLRRHLAKRRVQRRLQPFASPYFALIAEAVTISPSAAAHHQFDSLFNLPLIGVALFNHSYGNAVRAEDDLRVRRVGKS